MKRAALYARVSTQNQENEQTIKNQIMEIKEHIANDGNVLIDNGIYQDDGWSGGVLQRPSLDQLRNDLSKDLFDVVYVYDRSRLARKLSYQEIIIEELQDNEIEFITLKDADDPMVQTMQGVFYEFEKAKIYERFRLGKVRKVKDGKLLGYNPPYGYDYVAKTKTDNGYFVINEYEAEVIRKIYGWVANEGLSTLGVVRRLHLEGILPRKAQSETWKKGPVARILRNTSYYGDHYYLKTEAIATKNHGEATKYHRVKKNGRRIRPQDEWIKISVPVIISKELFDKAQQQLETNSKYASRNTKREYILQGLIYCPCDCKRTGEGIKDHIYYRCTDRLHKFPLPPTCTNGGINAKVVDSVVWTTIYDFINNPEIIKKQAEKWLASKSNDHRTTDAQKAKSAQAELQGLKEEETRYAIAYGKSIMSLETYEERIDAVQAKRAKLLKNISKFNNDASSIETLSSEELVKAASNTINELDFSDKKYIVRQLIDKVVADTKTVIITGHIPLKPLAQIGLSHADRNSWTAECR